MPERAILATTWRPSHHLSGDRPPLLKANTTYTVAFRNTEITNTARWYVANFNKPYADSMSTLFKPKGKLSAVFSDAMRTEPALLLSPIFWRVFAKRRLA